MSASKEIAPSTPGSAVLDVEQEDEGEEEEEHKLKAHLRKFLAIKKEKDDHQDDKVSCTLFK